MATITAADSQESYNSAQACSYETMHGLQRGKFRTYNYLATPAPRPAPSRPASNGLGGHGANEGAAGLQLLCSFWSCAFRQCGGGNILLICERVRRTLHNTASTIVTQP